MSYGYGSGYEGPYATGGAAARNYYQAGYGNQSAAASSYRKRIEKSKKPNFRDKKNLERKKILSENLALH